MDWDYIFFDLWHFYARLFFVYFAYLGSKLYAANRRGKINPPTKEKLWIYLKCAIVISIISLFYSNFKSSGGEDKYHSNLFDFNEFIIAFVLLYIPALFGCTDGFSTTEKLPSI